MIHDMLISSDNGLQWGNVTITPQELAAYIKGISIKNGKIELDGVGFYNKGEESFISDQDGVRHNVMQLVMRIEENGNFGHWQ